MLTEITCFLEKHKEQPFVFERNGVGFTVTTLFYEEKSDCLDMFLRSIDGETIHEQIMYACINVDSKNIKEVLSEKKYRRWKKHIYTHITVRKDGIIIEDVFSNSLKRIFSILGQEISEPLS